MTISQVLALGVLGVPLITALVAAVLPVRLVSAATLAGAIPTCGLGIAVSVMAIADSSRPVAGPWIVVDATGALFLAVISVVGLASVAMSPSYLRGGGSSFVGETHRNRFYSVTLLLFWALLLAIPMAGNLGAAWLVVEASTAVSALLVGFNGRARALEAGWKYLILTSLGLGVALLGVAILIAGSGQVGIAGLAGAHLRRFDGSHATALTAYVLLLVGLAAKIGWAPVHNWLPDAHSEAPPPVSALLSAALLPAVLLIAWRTQNALAPVVGIRATQRVLIAFGLLSLAVAVPFLWRPMAFKRLLAYSSLEHLGVMALGVGFGTPLALAGVALHVAGHAVAKALGFYSATALISHEPRSARQFVTGIGRTSPALGGAIGLSLGALSGLPPSPLFVSELLILAGGFDSGRGWASVVAAGLLAMGFLGLAHSAIETVAGKRRGRREITVGLRLLKAYVGVSVVILLGLTATGPWIASSPFINALGRGLP